MCCRTNTVAVVVVDAVLAVRSQCGVQLGLGLSRLGREGSGESFFVAKRTRSVDEAVNWKIKTACNRLRNLSRGARGSLCPCCQARLRSIRCPAYFACSIRRRWTPLM